MRARRGRRGRHAGSGGIPWSTPVATEALDADLFVAGPERPLVDGLADRLRAQGKLVFGPGADGARLEGSRACMKEIVKVADVDATSSQPAAVGRTISGTSRPRSAIDCASCRRAPRRARARCRARGSRQGETQLPRDWGTDGHDGPPSGCGVSDAIRPRAASCELRAGACRGHGRRRVGRGSAAARACGASRRGTDATASPPVRATDAPGEATELWRQACRVIQMLLASTGPAAGGAAPTRAFSRCR
jgi:hypothetical protein